MSKKPGDFMFGQVLGEGAYATVMHAKLKENDYEFAIKVVEKQHIKRENKVKYVMQERNIMTMVSHPLIVKLYYTFHDHDHLYFCMDVAHGGELAEYVRACREEAELVDYTIDKGQEQVVSRRACPEPEARFFTAQLLAALSYLHAKRIIHRDVKPENILLHRSGHIKLTDFGTALQLPKFEDSTYLNTEDEHDEGENEENLWHDRTSFVGTAEYVSPEVLMNEAVTGACDLWAVGCVLYNLLSGTTPFGGQSEYLTFQNITSHVQFGEDPTSEDIIDFPEHFSDSAKDLIWGLLRASVKDRLGYGGAEGARATFEAGKLESNEQIHRESNVGEVQNMVRSFSESTSSLKPPSVPMRSVNPMYPTLVGHGFFSPIEWGDTFDCVAKAAVENGYNIGNHSSSTTTSSSSSSSSSSNSSSGNGGGMNNEGVDEGTVGGGNDVVSNGNSSSSDKSSSSGGSSILCDSNSSGGNDDSDKDAEPTIERESEVLKRYSSSKNHPSIWKQKPIYVPNPDKFPTKDGAWRDGLEGAFGIDEDIMDFQQAQQALVAKEAGNVHKWRSAESALPTAGEFGQSTKGKNPRPVSEAILSVFGRRRPSAFGDSDPVASPEPERRSTGGFLNSIRRNFSLESASSDVPSKGSDVFMLEGDRNRWRSFCGERERLVFTSPVYKRKGLFTRKRQLILTDTPRLLYVDPDTMKVAGEVPWTLEDPVMPKIVSSVEFDVYAQENNRYYHFKTDEAVGSSIWFDLIEGALVEYGLKDVTPRESAPLALDAVSTNSTVSSSDSPRSSPGPRLSSSSRDKAASPSEGSVAEHETDSEIQSS